MQERYSDDEYIVASQQDSIGFFEKRSSYVHPHLWVSGTFKRSLNWRNRGTPPPKIPLAIAAGHGYLLRDLLFNNKFYLILYSIKLPTKGHDCNNREMLPMAIFILLDIYDLLKKGLLKRNGDRISSTAMPNMPILWWRHLYQTFKA